MGCLSSIDLAHLDHELAHQASPALDPVESVLVAFARETLWYQPAPLQRRAQSIPRPHSCSIGDSHRENADVG
jgi:hypothetical protein